MIIQKLEQAEIITNLWAKGYNINFKSYEDEELSPKLLRLCRKCKFYFETFNCFKNFCGKNCKKYDGERIN